MGVVMLVLMILLGFSLISLIYFGIKYVMNEMVARELRISGISVIVLSLVLMLINLFN